MTKKEKNDTMNEEEVKCLASSTERLEQKNISNVALVIKARFISCSFISVVMKQNQIKSQIKDI